VDGHSLHFPLIFRFYEDAVCGKIGKALFVDIDERRKILSKDQRTLHISDLGAGSRSSQLDCRSIANVYKSATSTKKLSELLYRIGKGIGAKNILELGTSLGITTSYLSKIGSESTIYTLEGSEEIYSEAEKQLAVHSNVRSFFGNINDTLPDVLSQMPYVDLAYVDANHTYEATLSYCQQVMLKRIPSTAIVIGDIHWSDEMEEAWHKIKLEDEVSHSIDLFECGILLFASSIYKQDYIVRF